MTAEAERTRGAEVVCEGVMHVYPGVDGPIAALRGVELTVRPGEMLAIVGPSGSGKTTLMSLLSGLLRPTAGVVRIGTHDLGRLDAQSLSQLRATELSLLLQDPLQNLLPYATVAENVVFASRGARRRGWPIQHEPGELLDGLGLAPVADRPVHLLSAGQQNRAAIASALSTSPRVLLADEPTGNLDPASRDRVIASLHEAQEITGATIIVVTHDMAVADSLPRSITISGGVIGAEGRGHRRFAVMGSDGSLQLPSEVVELFPSGTLFEVGLDDGTVRLTPEQDGGEA
jgi:ABC-type lipoprotein export system ATPase subunit